MHRFALRADRDGDRHVAHLKFVHGLHAEFRERDHPARAYRVGHQERRAAHGDHVRRTMPADHVDRCRAALGLADHGEQSPLAEHRLGEAVHAIGRGRARGPDHFVADRINRTHVVDHPAMKIEALRQWLPGLEQGADALVCRITPGQQLAGQQQALAGLPCRDLLASQTVERHPPRGGVGRPVHCRPQIEIRRLQHARGPSHPG